MTPRALLLLLKWVVVLGFVCGGLVAGYLVHTAMRKEREAEASGEKIQAPPRAKAGVVNFGQDSADRYGLQETPAQAVLWQERTVVYGRVIPNPRATTEIRSPFAGSLRAATDSAWPAPGQWIQAGQVLGWIDVRVGPEVRIDLENKVREARVKEKGAESIIKVQQDRVDSLKGVTDQGIISRGELDLAQVQLAEAKIQLATAKAAADLWQKAIEEVERRKGKDSPWSEPLTAPTAGEVTELPVRPGTAVEAGSLLLQLVDPRRALVRLDFPPELLSAGPPAQLQLYTTPAVPAALSGILNQPQSSPPPAMGATLAGPAPRLDPASQFVGFWYEVLVPPPTHLAPKGSQLIAQGNALGIWRPGLQVKAFVKAQDAEPRQAVSVPATAVLYHKGRALVYVRIEAGKYERREVQLLGSEGDSWIVISRQGEGLTGVAPGEVVVSRQAQVLLSEEFRAD